MFNNLLALQMHHFLYLGALDFSNFPRIFRPIMQSNFMKSFLHLPTILMTRYLHKMSLVLVDLCFSKVFDCRQIVVFNTRQIIKHNLESQHVIYWPFKEEVIVINLTSLKDGSDIQRLRQTKKT